MPETVEVGHQPFVPDGTAECGTAREIAPQRVGSPVNVPGRPDDSSNLTHRINGDVT